MADYHLILGSGSPRRKELLQQLRLNISIEVSDVDETPLDDESPEELVARLSLLKAKAVASNHPDSWVLGADTVVAVDGSMLGKPADREDSIRMLSSLQGRAHQVYGGFALVNEVKGEEFVQTSCTEVVFVEMTERDIDRYVATGEGDDKAGSYAVQGMASQFIQSINGSYSNVVGLDLAKVSLELKRNGINW